jgi:hypothetical protein
MCAFRYRSTLIHTAPLCLHVLLDVRLWLQPFDSVQLISSSTGEGVEQLISKALSYASPAGTFETLTPPTPVLFAHNSALQIV